MKEEPRLCADEKGAARRPTGNKSTSVPGGRKRSLPSAEGPERPGLRGWRGKNKIDARVSRHGQGEGARRKREREREKVTWARDEQNEIIREQDRQKNRIEIKGKVKGDVEGAEGRQSWAACKTNERMKRRWPRTSEMSYPSVSTVVCLLEGNRFPGCLSRGSVSPPPLPPLRTTIALPISYLRFE